MPRFGRIVLLAALEKNDNVMNRIASVQAMTGSVEDRKQLRKSLTKTL